MATKTVNVPVEFITLARAMLTAQKAGQHSQKEWRRAENLRQQFDAKLQTIEKVISQADGQQPDDRPQPPTPFVEKLL